MIKTFAELECTQGSSNKGYIISYDPMRALVKCDYGRLDRSKTSWQSKEYECPSVDAMYTKALSLLEEKTHKKAYVVIKRYPFESDAQGEPSVGYDYQIFSNGERYQDGGDWF